MTPLRISCLALATLDGMFEDNYRRALRLTEIALRGQPDILLLPEAFAAGYCGTDLTPFAEDPARSPWHRAFADLSRRGHCLIVFGYIEAPPPQPQAASPPPAPGAASARTPTLRNAVRLLDCGEPLGTHYKYSLWPDQNIAFRDEPAMMLPGAGIDLFPSRWGQLAILTCYENWLPENWAAAAHADLILSPYNAPGDSTAFQRQGVAQIARPAAWANRTGTVHWPADGKPHGVMPNLGTAGIAAADGTILARSDPGVETIVTAEVTLA